MEYGVTIPQTAVSDQLQRVTGNNGYLFNHTQVFM